MEKREWINCTSIADLASYIGREASENMTAYLADSHIDVACLTVDYMAKQRYRAYSLNYVWMVREKGTYLYDLSGAENKKRLVAHCSFYDTYKLYEIHIDENQMLIRYFADQNDDDYSVTYSGVNIDNE